MRIIRLIILVGVFQPSPGFHEILIKFRNLEFNIQGFSAGGGCEGGDEVVVANDLYPDESLLDVSVDRTTRFLRRSALANQPGRRDADHLRIQFADVPDVSVFAAVAGLAGVGRA